MRPPSIIHIVVFVAVSGCALPGLGSGDESSGIVGNVLIGPTCPVESDPPEPGCEDRPYEGRLAVTTVDGEKVVKEFRSAANGTFRVAVPPGEYQIRSAGSSGSPPYCATETTVEVRSQNFTRATVHCDSGIR